MLLWLALLWPSPAAAADPGLFALAPHAIGLAFNGTYLLAVGGGFPTDECGNEVTAYDSRGNSHLFATLPDQPGCVGSMLENAIVSVPEDLPGWQSGVTYVVRGTTIYSISTEGVVARFIEIPCPDQSLQDGATFDTIGTFGHALI